MNNPENSINRARLPLPESVLRANGQEAAQVLLGLTLENGYRAAEYPKVVLRPTANDAPIGPDFIMNDIIDRVTLEHGTAVIRVRMADTEATYRDTRQYDKHAPRGSMYFRETCVCIKDGVALVRPTMGVDGIPEYPVTEAPRDMVEPLVAAADMYQNRQLAVSVEA